MLNLLRLNQPHCCLAHLRGTKWSSCLWWPQHVCLHVLHLCMCLYSTQSNCAIWHMCLELPRHFRFRRLCLHMHQCSIHPCCARWSTNLGQTFMPLLCQIVPCKVEHLAWAASAPYPCMPCLHACTRPTPSPGFTSNRVVPVAMLRHTRTLV